MEENVTDGDSEQRGSSEARAGMEAIGVEGGDGAEQEEGDDGDVQQFDITLPATHSYLGTDLEQLGGRLILEAGWTGRVPSMAHHGTVFPGETVPMLMPHEPLRDIILQDRLFCLLCPDETGMFVTGMGVLCEVLAGAAEAGIMARAVHRVRMLNPRTREGYMYTHMQMIDIMVLPETSPSDPLRPTRLTSLDPFRRQEDSSLERVLRGMDAAGSPWPTFVWQLFDYRRLRNRLKEHFATMNLDDKMPADPVSLSFWVASNLALSARDRLALFAVDNALVRLRLALRCIDRSMALCCATCGAELSRRDHVFAMSSDGVHGNYTNYGGFMHDVVTVRTAHDTTLGAPSAEYSWFPGYRWRVAQCAACGTHVGWRFDAMQRKLRPAQFFALCRNAVTPRAEQADYGDADL